MYSHVLAAIPGLSKKCHGEKPLNSDHNLRIHRVELKHGASIWLLVKTLAPSEPQNSW